MQYIPVQKLPQKLPARCVTGTGVEVCRALQQVQVSGDLLQDRCFVLSIRGWREEPLSIMEFKLRVAVNNSMKTHSKCLT